MFNPNTSVLAGVDIPTLQGWLTDAQAAMASLNSGQKVVSVTITGGGQHREVTYQKQDSGALVYWIKQLQAQLGIIPAPRSRARIRYS